jgi:hypothetical protein
MATALAYLAMRVAMVAVVLLTVYLGIQIVLSVVGASLTQLLHIF